MWLYTDCIREKKKNVHFSSLSRYELTEEPQRHGKKREWMIYLHFECAAKICKRQMKSLSKSISLRQQQYVKLLLEVCIKLLNTDRETIFRFLIMDQETIKQMPQSCILQIWVLGMKRWNAFVWKVIEVFEGAFHDLLRVLVL